MKKYLPSLINIYFYIGYVYSILGIIISMTTTILYDYIDKIPFSNIISYLYYYLSIPYGLLFNESLLTVPHQVYSTGPVMSEYIFYSILLLVFVLYIFVLDNVRRIIISLVTKKFDNELISRSLLNIALLNFSIYFISLSTMVFQDTISSGFTFNTILLNLGGLFAGSIFFGIVSLIVRLLITRQVKLQKEIDEIV
jgi:hypothetical protein